MDYQELERLFPFKHRYITIGQNRIHYIDEGEGRTLVLFHACPMWSFAYRRQIAEFSRDHRVIAFDMLGFGLSDKPSDFDYTLTGHINLTESLIGAMDLKDITLVMHGWGGTIGMGFAVRHPNLIAGLVVLNSMAFSDFPLPWRLYPCRAPWLGAKIILDLKMLQFGVNKLPPEIAEAYRYPFLSKESRIPLLRFIEDIPVTPEAESAQTILTIETRLWMFNNKPSCIIWAMRDWLYNVKSLKRWERCLPNASVHLLPDAGRYMQEDAPDKVNAIMREFLAENKL